MQKFSSRPITAIANVDQVYLDAHALLPPLVSASCSLLTLLSTYFRWLSRARLRNIINIVGSRSCGSSLLLGAVRLRMSAKNISMCGELASTSSSFFPSLIYIGGCLIRFILLFGLIYVTLLFLFSNRPRSTLSAHRLSPKVELQHASPIRSRR